ncbi:MAG: HlyD family efflux transporter periplasmic adaptor subunit [SAR324 cluster bacterium]|uniref:HlyD family efflux transporter periplasmic adaptor subunit n=1 Tax=SAR324 cluster bacterium TaxID=2024889 RepID=A0A7X9FSZ3_9DELT|nr:HlyD family efflux transporter periplasmic adaptor subunit [SAR324 cluster bacterium]
MAKVKFIFLFLAFAFLIVSCSDNSTKYQGYVDADFVYLASPFGAVLEKLAVDRGSRVIAGDFLFALDKAPQEAAETEARRLVAQAKATLEDMRKGLRPSEINAIEARLSKAKKELDLAEKELKRLQQLALENFVSKNDLDKAITKFETTQKGVDELKSQLETSRLGARSDQILAAESNVHAMEANLEKAAWATSQQSKTAPIDSLVFDTFFKPGEFVPAGKPVVSLLSPQYLKVRFFVSEQERSNLTPGSKVLVQADGLEEKILAQITYIAPQAEYTSPFIYSQEQRQKLVFMVEARFEGPSPISLSPGQPVDVWPLR